MAGVWDHRRLGGNDYEIRRDGKPVVLVGINPDAQPSLLVRRIVQACADQLGGFVAGESRPAPSPEPPAQRAVRVATRADYEASDAFERDAREWWRGLSVRQRQSWSRVVRKSGDRDMPVHSAAFSMHGGPAHRAGMARWAGERGAA